MDIPGTVRIAGKVIARGVSYEQFMASDYGEKHVEWVNGVVIEMPSINERHDALIEFIRILFKIFLEKTTGGRIVGDPMVMKLDIVPSSRAPDIQVLLPDRLHQLKQNQVIGPANLVVEIVSPGSQRQDRVDKYREYELGSVPEYWIVDSRKTDAQFYQLGSDGLYTEVTPDANGVYHSQVLSGFRLSVDIFWRDTLPSVSETLQLVEAMLKTI